MQHCLLVSRPKPMHMGCKGQSLIYAALQNNSAEWRKIHKGRERLLADAIAESRTARTAAAATNVTRLLSVTSR